MIVFRKPLPGIDRPVMEADVVIVGGGPAGMACALRLSQLIDEHNANHPDTQLSKENIYLLEKAREVGAHCLSGALLDPRSMRELLPGFEKEAPLDAEVVKEAVYYLTRTGKFKFPITPPPMRDHGNYVISINKFVKWLGGKVEEAGITVFTGFAGSELLFESGRVAGVRTDDKGVDKNGQQKSNFEPGYDLKSKVVILAEGTRGSLTKQLIGRFQLDRERNPQTYGVGVKELWELPAGRVAAGRSHLHHGLSADLQRVRRSLDLRIERQHGFAGLCHRTRLSRSAHRSAARSAGIQEASFHRQAAGRRKDGALWREVAALWWVVVRSAVGRRWLDDSRRLSRLPQFAAAEGNSSGDQERNAGGGDRLRRHGEAGFFARTCLSRFKSESRRAGSRRSYGRCGISIRDSTGDFSPEWCTPAFNNSPADAGCARGTATKPAIIACSISTALPADGGPEAHIIGPAKGDGKLTFDKLTDLYHSGTKHEEDQPAHLVIHDTTICNERCVTEFGNPCKNFCPANVYEMVEAQDTPSGLEIHLNPSNCVHCKTCDIMDPYEIITWVPPEGGGGPNYEGM